MNREEIARDGRRRQAREQLEFERDREAALRDQLEDVIAERHGAAVDESAFAQMAPEDVEIVRPTISGGEDEEPFEAEWIPEDEGGEDDAAELAEAEIARLDAELDASRRRQAAFAAYLAALDAAVPVPPDG